MCILKEVSSFQIVQEWYMYCTTSKNSAWISSYCLSFAKFLKVNIQHSIRVHIVFPYIAYTCDDLCRIIRDHFWSFCKGCRIIRRAKFLEVVRYLQCLLGDFMLSVHLSQGIHMITGILDYCQPEKWCQYDYWIHCNSPSLLGARSEEGAICSTGNPSMFELSLSTCTHHTNRFLAISMWGTRPRWTSQWSTMPGRVVSALWGRGKWMPMNWQNKWTRDSRFRQNSDTTKKLQILIEHLTLALY